MIGKLSSDSPLLIWASDSYQIKVVVYLLNEVPGVPVGHCGFLGCAALSRTT